MDDQHPKLPHQDTLSRREALRLFGGLAVGLALPGCSDPDTQGAQDGAPQPSNDAGMDAAEDANPSDASGEADADDPSDAHQDIDPGPEDTSDDAQDPEPDADPAEPDADDAGDQPDAPEPGTCTLTPEQGEGPFFIDTGLERVDITEGRPGTPLRVGFTLVDAQTCEPIKGAAIELWHADAAGIYSGFDEEDGNLIDAAGETFMRGYQLTDEHGEARFLTVYPGWYPGRTPHVHVTILFGDRRLITTQFYFEDAISDMVYAQAPYPGPHDTRNPDDRTSRRNNGPGPDPLIFTLTRNGQGYDARFTVAVDQS